MLVDETKRINPPGETNGIVLYERFFGDYPAKAYADICTIRPDPSPGVTNWYRFDVNALNGSYWEMLILSKVNKGQTNEGWYMKLKYKWSNINGKVQVEPPEQRGTIMVY